MKSLLPFLAKLLANKYADGLLARLGATLFLAKFGVVGVLAKTMLPFVSGFIGLMIESGVFKLDLTIDALQEGAKLREFQKAAKEAYAHAKSKVHTPEEKERIRQQYLDIIRKFAPL